MAEKHRIEFCNPNQFESEGGNDLIFIDFEKTKHTMDSTIVRFDSDIITLDNI
ncbi:hypothetical protein [Aquimarina sp. 2201CG14-23]|uniref:hypothetical protein n=1 Tax=Aquimarina mycalae TaxID=3040073 RepID=UPI002477F44A|nr:hypothetical protein [Aquimarina sp. 2201CG14-23]MDH7444682.1 hypothetical protein [Aquimarina sp. 2201CG14-23]